MTNTELAILGLIAEEPSHAYRLESEIEARGMREWTEIGFSSIYYVLNKLEQAGWLTSAHSLEAAGPARRIYSLTETGRQMYRSAVRERLAYPRPYKGDFLLGLANLPALSEEEVRHDLATRQVGLEREIAQVREKLERDRTAFESAGQVFPNYIGDLFDHSLTLMAAELTWVSSYLQRNQGETDG